jgi:chromosome partitioning protein
MMTADPKYRNREAHGRVMSRILVVSTDSQGSAVWWADRVGDRQPLPFDFSQAHDDPGSISNLRNLGAKVHVVANQKGGVGKTTVAVNLGAVVTEALGPSENSGYLHVFVDTPGSLDDDKTLRACLEEATDVLIPLPTEPLAFDPTARTIANAIKPTGLPYKVVINNWDPRDGKADLNETCAYVNAMGWPLAHTVIRRYKIHTRASLEGMVVTQYPKNRVALEAREDFLRLAVELGYGGAV